MKRRDFLKAAGAATFLPAAQAAEAKVVLSPREAGAEIDPLVHGHFIEHLGGVIYDGIWVGRDSKIPNVEGLRQQFVDDMKRLRAPVLRWPGGCFADGYHWRDGIGPVSWRPRTYNFWQPRMPAGVDATETNHFGTHEFLRLCELTGAAPYLAANVGSGAPREFYDWVMYCNAPPGTVRQAEEREAHGRRDPYNVRFWGVGNESWGCGGNYKPQEYAAEYRRYVAQLPRYGSLYLIAVGPNGGDLNWTRGFFEALPRGWLEGRRGPVDGFALHYYTRLRGAANRAVGFNTQEWYALLEAGARIEQLIEDHWKIMGEFDKSHRVKLVVDEWGTWYAAGTEIGPQYLFSQTITLRDALHSALTLDIFQRHADKVSMANVAQTINCIASLFLAQGDRYVRTPMFHVFEMYLPHQGGRLVPAAIQAGEIEFTGDGGARKLFGLTGSASLKEDRVTLTLVNPALDGPLELSIQLAGAAVREARAAVLTHADMGATNTYDAPEQVAPQPLPVTVAGSGARVRLPGKSVSAFEFRIG